MSRKTAAFIDGILSVYGLEPRPRVFVSYRARDGFFRDTERIRSYWARAIDTASDPAKPALQSGAGSECQIRSVNLRDERREP